MRPLLAAALALSLLATAWAQAPAPSIDFGTGEEALRIESPQGQVRYDEERSLIYGTERVTITYKGRTLTADAVVFDPLTREAQAYGNVVIEGPSEHFEADTMWYNFVTEEGIARNARGYDGDLYFRGAEFRRLSPEEMLFRRGPVNWNRLETEAPRYETPRYTTCDFPEPHVALRARAFDLFPGDRVFARNLVVEVQGIPVFYLPFFTHSLGAGHPWAVRAGYSSLLGAFLSVDYNYRHRLFEPDPFTGEMRRRAAGHLRVGGDYYTRRGLGLGAEYGYEFDYGAQRGRWQGYFINDRGREDMSRWLVQGNHRWQLSDDVVAVIGADLVSDPDLYEDFFSTFDLERSRGRVFQRRVYGALTVTQDDFVSRLSADWRERVTRDRFTNFSEPSDDNDDFRFDQDNNGRDDLNRRFPQSRWGEVSERYEYAFSTNELQIGNLPIFYDWDLRLFANRDAGLNHQSSRDDSRVYGIDLYQSLLWTYKLTERLTLLVRGGLGIAAANRDSDSFHVHGPFPRRMDNVIFADDGSFYVGTDMVGADGLNDFVLDGTEGAFGTKRLDLRDVDTAWVYGDIRTRLQARLSDALTAYAEWRYRKSSGMNLGEFYREAGNRTFTEDLYAFRLDQHWAEVGLRYSLLRPDLTTGIRYERNLHGKSDIFQGETIQRVSGDITWRNAAQTVRVGLYGNIQETQLRHPSDSREVQLTTATAALVTAITPRSRVWEDTFTISGYVPLKEDPFAPSDTRRNQINENRNDVSFTNVLGVRLSPLWNVRWQLRLTDTGGSQSTGGSNAGTSIVLDRDLHDAVLTLGLAAKNEDWRGGGGQGQNRVEATVALRFRRSSEEPIGVARPVLVVPQRRPSEIDEGI
jgi:hypothetical protein